MPMLDVFIPPGAFEPDTERGLIDELTTILLRAEGADPDDPAVRPLAWVFLHRPEIFVAGARADAPHYRVIATVPEGQLNGRERKERLISEVTDAILHAEGADPQRDRDRVWVFPLEIPEGHWGSHGRVQGLESILTAAVGDSDKARDAAQRRVNSSRQEKTARY